MILRTPRRRISPRTKKRCRAIKNFLHRAIGNSSQHDIKINSNIAINVSDIKHKILGIKQQLDQVSRTCRSTASFENDTDETASDRHTISTIKEQSENPSFSLKKLKLNGTETKILYKTSEDHFKKTDESESIPKHAFIYCDGKNSNVIRTHSITSNGIELNKRRKQVNSRIYELDDKADGCCKMTNSTGASSYYSIYSPQLSQRHIGRSERNVNHHEHIEGKRQRQHKSYSPMRGNNKRTKKHVSRTKEELDDNFIADIIRRQYQPVQLFGRRNSDLSQISAPVCRDREFSMQENIQENSELCPCCCTKHNNRRHTRPSDLSDIRSICDTRLYSSKRGTRRKQKRHVDIYNDARHYDIVPVKEKSSPKSRRKFVETYYGSNVYQREVPPSPKSLRPRLNLRAQHCNEFYDSRDYPLSNKNHPVIKAKKHHIRTIDSDITSDTLTSPNTVHLGKPTPLIPLNDQKKNQQEGNAKVRNKVQESSVKRKQQHAATNSINETSLNKSNDSELNKTDKTLSEIKVILQNFLQEIKKETTATDANAKLEENKTIHQQDSTKLMSGFLQNNGFTHCHTNSGGQYNIPHVPSVPNPCCFPIVPMCPVNYMQNGYVIPSPSYNIGSCTCQMKENLREERECSSKTKPTEITTSKNTNNETEELIKEIHKFVAQKAHLEKKKYNESTKILGESKPLISRSVGGSYKSFSKCDAKVGTPILKCYSKSCEAIGSRMITEPYYSKTNASYSDTLLEKLSLEVSKSTDSDFSLEKPRENKFTKALRSFGLLKKKKRDVIDELNESESTIEVDVKKKPPFRQNITNYMMHDQEFYKPPQAVQHQHNDVYKAGHRHAQHVDHHHGHPEPNFIHSPEYKQYCNCNCLNRIQPGVQDIYGPHKYPINPGHCSPHNYQTSPSQPTGSIYGPHFAAAQPQIPLCLKEVEVKSTGTQSERKVSFFQKLAMKANPPKQIELVDPQKNFATQTTQNKEGFWKNLQAKAMADMKDNEILNFQMQTRKKLEEGGEKMRNKMVKKMFYKRNPFSPGNLIMKTLLGRDKSSFGEPPIMYRPRTFL